ncbi:MAG: hypothetical protein JOY80_10310 [Candidatus Dormibacteraeota bacterium]|nr:hypothetical protein [Candidatus Dormibacteraeota bacterium]
MPDGPVDQGELACRLALEIAVEAAVPTDLYGALGNLIEVVRAHLRLEEEALQRMVEGKLSEAEIYDLYERMETAEFDAIIELSAPAPQ